jgi:hypothetical protein
MSEKVKFSLGQRHSIFPQVFDEFFNSLQKPVATKVEEKL